MKLLIVIPCLTLGNRPYGLIIRVMGKQLEKEDRSLLEDSTATNYFWDKIIKTDIWQDFVKNRVKVSIDIKLYMIEVMLCPTQLDGAWQN